MTRIIKQLLPRSLFGRALLIIVAPLILLQVVTTYFFYEQHWDTLSRRLSQAVAGDIALAITLFEHAQDDAQRERIFDLALTNNGIRLAWRPGEILPNETHLPYGTSVAAMLNQALDEKVRRPALIDDETDDRQVQIQVQLRDGVMSAVMTRKRLFSSTTYVFVLWMVGTSLILFAVAGVFMRNQVRPIRRLAAAAESFGKGLEVPDFKAEGATEVRLAAIEFNRMRERITRQITQRTEMLAGVSHDLRTPLTRMKLELAMLGSNPDVDGMKSDVAEMERMIDGYLAFARGEGSEIAVRTALRPLLEEVVVGVRRDGGAVELEVAGEIELSLRPNAFRRVMTNLVANACRYGRHVLVQARRRGNTVELTVDDDGPGIPASRREDVFKPFFRLDPSRNPATGGVGLGLTIARDVVRGHGGDVLLDDSPLGGLRATVRLPV